MQGRQHVQQDQPAPILDARGPDPQPAGAPGVELDVDGDHAVEWVSGEIDAANADHVAELGSLAIAEPRVDELVVDLSRVTFMGSSGLGALIQLRDHSVAASKRIALRGVPATVGRVMAITGVDRVFGLPKGDGGRC